MDTDSAGILFLHGGPGLSAGPERERLGRLAQVCWWDQPRVAPGTQGAYASLLEAAEGALRACVARHGGPCHLLASSFGGALAVALAERMPDQIASIVLLSPSTQPELCYARLARHLIAARADSGQLAAALASYMAATDQRPRFWQLIGAIMEVPDFSHYYWHPGAQTQAAWFGALLAQPGMFDAATFQAVLDDYAVHEPSTGRPAFSGPVMVQFGRHDPVLDAECEARQWQRLFPQATVGKVDAGHFIHLELAPEQWLPGRAVIQ